MVTYYTPLGSLLWSKLAHFYRNIMGECPCPDAFVLSFLLRKHHRRCTYTCTKPNANPHSLEVMGIRMREVTINGIAHEMEQIKRTHLNKSTPVCAL